MVDHDSISTRVSYWLAGLADYPSSMVSTPTPNVKLQEGLTAQDLSLIRKRRFDSSVCQPTADKLRKKQRTTLSVLSGNRTSQPRASKRPMPRGKTKDHPLTPHKGSAGAASKNTFDDEQTPRPQQDHAVNINRLHLKTDARLASSVDEGDQSSQYTTDTKSSKKRNGDSSPDKMASQRFMVEPVITKPIDLGSSATMPHQLEALLRPVSEYSLGCGFLHAEMEVSDTIK